MKKRICACLLAACALLGLAPAALAREDAPEGLVVCGSLYLAAQARGLLTK